jgi:hypothetical protein
MKKLLLVLFLIPFFSLAQSEPSKGDNTIVVKSDKEDLFDLAMMRLLQDGFEIKDSNEKYQTISTESKKMSEYASYRFIISIIDDQVQLQGRWKNDIGNAVFNTQGFEYEMVWKKKGGESHIWKYLESFASNFGTDRSYFKN